MGSVQFEGVTDVTVAFDATWADGLVDLGQADALPSLGRPESCDDGYYEQFGECHGVGTHSENERLFDRRRLADTINGAF